ncbi:NF038215 family lipoprotein [Acinetobacter brisouii]|uniref:NF038215 family lipoprotein n=2 Tax=Acinetobacter TaxID=469 RepID=UPI0027E3C199|nr:NF038215 family lipoprotein [Acinetobacter brisouii]
MLMKTISILCVAISLSMLTGCELKQPVKTQSNYYSKSIAGMPVYEKDYQLSAAN